MSNAPILQQFDHWLQDDSPFAALVMRQWLAPVEGKEAVIFPPTYAKPERMRDEDWTGYNIDRFEDGSSICLIDSVGSQANRLEPIFKRTPYCRLVPQVTIVIENKKVNLLDAGHRAADAVVRFSDLGPELENAFRAIRDTGNAEPLAKIAPTSILFGCWDSRATQVKLPRIIRFVIRAYNVRPLHRSAQYIPPIDYVGEGVLDSPKDNQQQEAMSELGLRHAPAPWSHGGVQVLKEIRREASLTLTGIRALGVADHAAPDERVLKLRRYILGLALVAFTAPQETFLREGCQLAPDPDHPTQWELVRQDGTRTPWNPPAHQEALQYAQSAAQDFGVGPDRTATFDPKAAKEALAQSKQERKAKRRQG